MKKLLKIILNRRLMVIALLLLQAGFIAGLILTNSTRIVMAVLELLSIFVVLYVVNRRDKGAYKIAWIILLLTFPLFGGLLYIIITWQSKSGAFRKYVIRNEEYAKTYIPIDQRVVDGFLEKFNRHQPKVNYLTNYARFPLYSNSATEFYPSGEAMFSALLCELQKAKSFIFLEYFIIDEDDRMWLNILEILKEKAANGIEVRVMYDDMGCMGVITRSFRSQLKKYGIKTTVFNPFRPFWSSLQNNRDHRKIAVIDGVTAFTGGVNIADEYINEKQRFGHWRDCGVMVKGEAVKTFTDVFLQLWNAANRKNEDFSPYLPEIPDNLYNDGYVLPFADTPVDDENVCEHVYMQIINNAQRYVYIETPYFIIDDSMLSAICLAAKSGVDVRIITPAVPDKKLVHMTTRSYYKSLIDSGVRVYEYTPGFIHSKVVVSDDESAVVGTANFDFRSLYLHYECGELMFGSAAVESIKKDFLSILPQCRRITQEDVDRNVFVRFGQSVLRIIAPLL